MAKKAKAKSKKASKPAKRVQRKLAKGIMCEGGKDISLEV